LGQKKAFRLVTKFHLTNPATVVDDLEKIAEKGDIAPLAGFGEKSQSEIQRALAGYKLGNTKKARMTLPYASDLAQINDFLS